MSSDCDQTITVSHHISHVVVRCVTLLRPCTVLSRTAASPNASTTSGIVIRFENLSLQVTVEKKKVKLENEGNGRLRAKTMISITIS
eukprot:scaffold13721_cov69-Cylindrotheca_fusiformis.AAC.2